MKEWRAAIRRLDAAGGCGARPADDAPAEALPRDLRVEEFLEQLCAPLAGWMTRAHYLEKRAELAARVDALVDAHRELGRAPEEAARVALAQLGDGRRLASEWARECRRVTGVTLPRDTAMLLSLPLLAVALLGAFGLAGLTEGRGLSPLAAALGGPIPPLAVGALVGWCWHGRHAWGGVWGLLIALAGAGAAMHTTIEVSINAALHPGVLSARLLAAALVLGGAAGLAFLFPSLREASPAGGAPVGRRRMAT